MNMTSTIPEIRWLRLNAGDADGLARAQGELRCRFPLLAEGYEEDDHYVYLRITTMVRAGDEVRQETVLLALGDDILVTLEDGAGLPSFDRGLATLRRKPEFAADPRGVLYVLLRAMNTASEQIVELASASLEAMNAQIGLIMNGVDERGREIGVSDISGAMVELNDSEELVSRIQEGQLLLERAARYLRLDLSPEGAELWRHVEILLSDIASVKERAGFEHSKLRYLQNSVMTSLNVKQNQIVKVFTIITAVFLPPTLVATFYGMNFAVMPELAWKHGFPATIVLTLLAALLPLIYIKQKGWLR